MEVVRQEQEGEERELEDEENGEGLSTPEKIVRRKVRQHVNPLQSQYQQPTKLDSNWLSKTFKIPGNSFIIDVGCSKGSWALNLCEESPLINIIGLEIRRPVVDFALSRKKQRGLENVHFIGIHHFFSSYFLFSHFISYFLSSYHISIPQFT